MYAIYIKPLKNLYCPNVIFFNSLGDLDRKPPDIKGRADLITARTLEKHMAYID